MKKLGVLSVVFLAMFAATAQAAITIDGNLNDWGVTPFTDWVPTSATADYTVENNTNRPGSDPFNEAWDIEAMYFDDDADYFYVGVVSSNPYTGDWASEDIGIDLNNDNIYEYGLDTANAVNNQLVTHNLYSVNTWNYMRGIPYSIATGNVIGTFQLYNRALGNVEPGTGQPATYVIEARISRLLFGNIACGVPINLIFSRVTCLKDWITVSGECDGNCNPTVVPEPASLLLLGSGLCGLAGLKRRKK